jgi:hypothetical protein
MTYLEKAETGKKEFNIFGIIHGPSGVGKTTWASEAPDNIFLPTEDGTNNLDVARLPRPKSFTEASNMIVELIENEHKYKTLTIDSIDWLESLLWTEICAENNVKSIIDLAYGRGYSLADNKWKDFVQKLKTLRAKMNIILIAHSQVASFSDPVTASSYDRYQIKLHKGASALFKEAVDFIGFANYQTFVKKDGMKNRAFGDGARALFTEYRPSHDGKNRYGLPYELPLSWADFMNAVKAGKPNEPDVIRSDILTMLGSVKDESLKKIVFDSVEKAGNDAIQLSKIQNRLRIKLEV